MPQKKQTEQPQPVIPRNLRRIKIERLTPYAKNSRTHSDQQIEQIAASIREFGFTNPILVDKDRTIIAGHGRVLAAQKIGMKEVPCVVLDHLTETQRRAYVIADNKLALNAGWNMEMLRSEVDALVAEGFDIDVLGFNPGELPDVDASGAERDVDSAPAPARVAVSKAGDKWLLGNHVVLCGDSTSAEDMDALMAAKKADAVWTDPPYNVAYETSAGSIANDNLDAESFRKFLASFYAQTFRHMRPGAAIYVAHADMERVAFTAEFDRAGFKMSGVIIWKKDSLVLGRSDYQSIHEPIIYGWKPGAAHRWHGGRAQTTVCDAGSSGSPFVHRQDGKWQVTVGDEVFIVDGNATVEYHEDSIITEARPRRSEMHPTMKPVALIQRMLKNNTRPGDVVLDPFGGSGSTLMACETLGLSARLIELSPVYVDVIVRRWQEFTGKHATHAATGRRFPGE